jgi:hypothetical protein
MKCQPENGWKDNTMIAPYTLPCNRIARANAPATLDLRHPRLHRFSDHRRGIRKQEINTGHIRAFFGLAFFPFGKSPRPWRGIGLSFPIVLHVKGYPHD